MADISFPTAQVLHGEVSEEVVGNLYRTEMESGPAKTAPKQSKTTINFSVPVIMTAGDYASFKSTWWPTTSKYGSKWFNIDLGEGAIEVRCTDGTFRAQPVSPRKTHYRVTLNVEAIL